MAWSWSHTEDAYIYAQAAMEALDRKTREIIGAEWLGRETCGIFETSTSLDSKRYVKGLIRVREWTDCKLNAFIWSKMSSENGGRTCTNGGWQAYCCPYGCGCHLVPFGPEEEESPFF